MPTAAKIIVMGTEGGDIYIVKQPNSGKITNAVDKGVDRRPSAVI